MHFLDREVVYFMKKIIRNDILKVVINTNGAFIDEFCFGEKNIFYPRFTVDIDGYERPRGGMHPCLPQFGISEINKLMVHGYGRDLAWEIIEEDQNRIVLALDGHFGYEGMNSLIEYSLGNNKFDVKLTLKNLSNNNLLVAPGFHPYFYYDKNFSIDGVVLNDDDLSKTIFVKSNEINFRTGEYEVKILTDNFNVFAIWSDFIENYICIEPTFNGNSFTKDKNNPYILNANEEFKAQFSIEIG